MLPIMDFGTEYLPLYKENGSPWFIIPHKVSRKRYNDFDDCIDMCKGYDPVGELSVEYAIAKVQSLCLFGEEPEEPFIKIVWRSKDNHGWDKE